MLTTSADCPIKPNHWRIKYWITNRDENNNTICIQRFEIKNSAPPLNYYIGPHYQQSSSFSLQFAIFCLLAAACSRCRQRTARTYIKMRSNLQLNIFGPSERTRWVLCFGQLNRSDQVLGSAPAGRSVAACELWLSCIAFCTQNASRRT
jgi:hypothetical protein